MLTTEYLLLPTRYSLLATHYRLLPSSYSLLTTHYFLLPTHYSLLTTHYSLLTTHYSLLTTRYSLLTTHYSLLTTHSYLEDEMQKGFHRESILGADNRTGLERNFAHLSLQRDPAADDNNLPGGRGAPRGCCWG